MPETFDVSVVDLVILVVWIIATRVLALWMVRGKSNDAAHWPPHLNTH